MWGLYRYLRKNNLRPVVSVLAAYLGTTHILIGLAALAHPQWYASAAYAKAERVLPIQAWGALMLITGLTLVAAAIWRLSNLVRVGLIWYSTIQWMFGISVLWLTVEGSIGAFAGFFQWITGSVAALIVLSGPVTGDIKPGRH